MKNVSLCSLLLIGNTYAMENNYTLVRNRAHEPVTYTLHVDDTNPKSKNLYAGLGIKLSKWKNLKGENNATVHKAIELPEYKQWENNDLSTFYTILKTAQDHFQIESTEWQNIEGQNFFYVTLPYSYKKSKVEEWYKRPGSLIKKIYTQKEFEPIKSKLLERQIIRDIMNVGVTDYMRKSSYMETSLCNTSCEGWFCSCCPNIHRLECNCTSDEQKIINDAIELRFKTHVNFFDMMCLHDGALCFCTCNSLPDVIINFTPGNKHAEEIAQKYGLPQNYQAILKGKIEHE